MNGNSTRSEISEAIAGLAQVAKEHGLDDLNLFLALTAALVNAAQEKNVLRLYAEDMERPSKPEGGAPCE